MSEIIAACLGALVAFVGALFIMNKQFKIAREKDLEGRKLAKNKEINHFCVLFNDGYRLLLSMKNIGYWTYDNATYSEKLKLFCNIHKDKDIAYALEYSILVEMEKLSILIQDKLLPLLVEENNISEIIKKLTIVLEICSSIETDLIQKYGDAVPGVPLIFKTSYEHTIY